jgi:hypothetical protein
MNRKGLAIVVLVAIVLFLLFGGGRSNFGMSSQGGQGMSVAGYNLGEGQYTQSAAGVVQGKEMKPAPLNGAMGDNIGQSVSSASLIPRDVVATEDFGQFSPDKILGNQNYLDPRSQIGYPETLGGVLRNANRDFRSEPLNPRTPVSIFNLSTIPPDVMRPRFEIDYEYQ